VSDFIGQEGVGTTPVWVEPVGTWPAPQRSGYGVLGATAKPPAVAVEYGIKNYSEAAPPYAYDNEGAALRALTHQRKELARFGVPEEFWPVLLKRSVEVVTGSWEVLSA
jgi:hypothetical protein